MCIGRLESVTCTNLHKTNIVNNSLLGPKSSKDRQCRQVLKMYDFHIFLTLHLFISKRNNIVSIKSRALLRFEQQCEFACSIMNTPRESCVLKRTCSRVETRQIEKKALHYDQFLYSLFLFQVS